MVSNSVRALLEEMGLIGVNPTEGESYRKLSKEEKRIARQNEAENRKQALTKLAELNTTFGEFLWNRIKKGQSVRARPLSDSKLYDVYPTREMLEDEFVKIWNSSKAILSRYSHNRKLRQNTQCYFSISVNSSLLLLDSAFIFQKKSVHSAQCQVFRDIEFYQKSIISNG